MEGHWHTNMPTKNSLNNFPTQTFLPIWTYLLLIAVISIHAHQTGDIKNEVPYLSAGTKDTLQPSSICYDPKEKKSGLLKGDQLRRFLLKYMLGLYMLGVRDIEMKLKGGYRVYLI